MEISLEQLRTILFPCTTNSLDAANSYAARKIIGWDYFEARAIEPDLAVRILAAQEATKKNFFHVQRVGEHTYLFLTSAWMDSPYRKHILKQKSDALRAEQLAAEEAAKVDATWRADVHGYMSKVAIRILDESGLGVSSAFVKRALQDRAAEFNYDLDKIRAYVAEVFGFDDAMMKAIFAAPPTIRKTNEQTTSQASHKETSNTGAEGTIAPPDNETAPQEASDNDQERGAGAEADHPEQQAGDSTSADEQVQ